jgi:hypothetical protein
MAVLASPSCKVGVVVFRRFARSCLRGALAASVGALMVVAAPTANAQTAAAVSIVIIPEVPTGATLAALPTGTGQRITIQITNTGTAALTNQQFVVRLAQKPDLISAVNDGAGNVGLVDATTGAWYHTIAQLAPGVTLSYAVSAFKFCPGRWPIAVRVGDKSSVTLGTWVGQPDTRCVPDEAVSPAPASYYSLTWPPTPPVVPPASTTSTIVPSATTTTGPTIPGATTPTTVPQGGPKPTLINLTLNATTTTTTTTTLAPATTVKPGRAPTTTIVFCKTVGGTRYCAPKYSVYKEGQKKAIELPTKSKKTTKKKKR